MSGTARVAFVGAGAIARCHAFAMSAMRFYYEDAPETAPVLVTSARDERASAFALRYGFARAASDSDFWASRDIDTVFVLSPNRLHFEHARRALEMPAVKRIYLEKPICVTADEARLMGEWRKTRPDVSVHCGYQLTQLSSLRRARDEWRAGTVGTPLHFRLSVLHCGYLDAEYRATRALRLAPMPEGGALVDLGSHLLSLAVMFFGNKLSVVSAYSHTPFPEVDTRSDMHTVVVLRDQATGALGTVTASRIAAGHEDSIELELSGDKGGLRYTSARPDALEIDTTPTRQEWRSVRCASDYTPESRFPAKGVSGGWLRPLLHAHYLFFTDNKAGHFVPDLEHGLVVQRLIQEACATMRPS
jgi:predicted dehydrogenase